MFWSQLNAFLVLQDILIKQNFGFNSPTLSTTQEARTFF
jgi:hypothetical protein